MSRVSCVRPGVQTFHEAFNAWRALGDQAKQGGKAGATIHNYVRNVNKPGVPGGATHPSLKCKEGGAGYQGVRNVVGRAEQARW